jgi:hypothetical protein
MGLIKKTISLFLSSDELAGAINKSSLGDRFSVQLNTPIAVPHTAVTCNLRVTDSSIWNSSPNISAVLGNNKLYFHSSYVPTPAPTIAAPVDFDVTIPDGLYSLDGLKSLLQREFIKLGHPKDLVVLAGDFSTQRTVLIFTYADTWMDFNPTDTPSAVLGFDSRLVPLTSQAASYPEYADKVAAFNRINYYLIKTDLISNGISINEKSNGIIHKALITAEPGKQTNFSPFNIPTVDASELIGHSKSYMTFQLVDQLNRDVDTNNESYGFTIVIDYEIPRQ